MRSLRMMILILPGLLAGALAAQTSLELGLEASVEAALKASPGLRAAQLEAEAAQARVRAARAVLLPRLSLDGSYRWVREIPSVKFGPTAPAAPFGDHHNYSLGVAATWDIFGGLGSWRRLQAAQAQADAKAADAAAQAQALRLRARLAYFQAQMAATRVRLLSQSLGLAQSQSQDLQLRLKAGTSSRIDALSASNEELDRRAQFRLAQADLAAALRELLALSLQGQSADLSLPMPDSLGQSLPADVGTPSLRLRLDPAEALLAALGPAGERPLAAEHPRLRVLRAQVEAARRQADAAAAGHWPRGSVGAKQSLDYPNGPVLEQVNQTQATAGLSLPLFSFGAVSHQVNEGRALARAAAERAQGAADDLRRDYDKSRDRLNALKAQQVLLLQRSRQAEDLRDLVYRAYKIGGANYLEVQASGLRALQAGLDLAVSETQMLIELAHLAALTDSEN